MIDTCWSMFESDAVMGNRVILQ